MAIKKIRNWDSLTTFLNMVEAEIDYLEEHVFHKVNLAETIF